MENVSGIQATCVSMYGSTPMNDLLNVTYVGLDSIRPMISRLIAESILEKHPSIAQRMNVMLHSVMPLITGAT